MGTRAPIEIRPAGPAGDAPVRAVIVAHGSPSDPAAQEAALAAIAAVAAASCPFPVVGATLAADGSLARALDAAPPGARVLVFPHFMSDGWFVSDLLPRRIATARPVAILPPLGLDPALPALCLARAAAAARAAGFDPATTRLALAAHGSPGDPRPARAARAAAATIAAAGVFRAVGTCFVEEPPFLAEGLGEEGPAVCLPFFATRAGHVTEDLAEAAAEAGFAGPILDPIGLDPEAARLAAAALVRAAGATAQASG
jgi:sirohydrochlorin ferrochelatase